MARILGSWRRPYVVFRSRVATHPAEPGTGGRKWRKIGVPC
jgi:nitrate reductase gamma subunit